MEKVRRIRNELERRGHNPLLFFLKCLEADDARLPDIIRDEIKARTFFVLCNTRASRRSKWAKQEIERVKQVTKRPRQTVVVMNLERDLQTELPKLDRLSKRATVFLSYARQPETPCASLRFQAIRCRITPMNATFTLDDSGQINLPEALKRVFGAGPGVRVQAEVTADRIEIVKVLPEVTEGVMEDGVLVLPRLGIKMDAAAAVRADREEQAGRALRR